jgi:hypothetical protein
MTPRFHTPPLSMRTRGRFVVPPHFAIVADRLGLDNGSGPSGLWRPRARECLRRRAKRRPHTDRAARCKLRCSTDYLSPSSLSAESLTAARRGAVCAEGAPPHIMVCLRAIQGGSARTSRCARLGHLGESRGEIEEVVAGDRPTVNWCRPASFRRPDTSFLPVVVQVGANMSRQRASLAV